MLKLPLSIPLLRVRSRYRYRRLLSLAPLLLVLAVLVPGSTAAAPGPPPAYSLIQADDFSDGNFFRVRFGVETKELVDRESAEAIARDLVERRTSRRVLHVVEVRIRRAGAPAEAPPEAIVTWAVGGDPERRPSGAPDDYSAHVYTVLLGTEAAAVARADLAVAERMPPPVPERNPETAREPAATALTPSARNAPGVRGVLGESPPINPARGSEPIRVDDRQALGRAEVLSLLRGWRAAWEARDLAAYLAYYSPEFRSGTMDLAGWGAHKTQVFASAGEIHVELDEIEVSFEGEAAVASFIQDYRSAAHGDRGRKRLVFEKSAGAYKIVSEDWSKL